MKKVQIEYIRLGDIIYYNQPAGVQNPKSIKGVMLDVCIIKKLPFGRYRIDRYNPLKPTNHYSMFESNQHPNERIIAYPSGISEIKYNTPK